MHRVLIVDDNDSIRLVIEQGLLGAGFAVTGTDDGVGVPERLRREAYDLVVLDLHMPGMNGFEVLRQLRHPSPGRRRTAARPKVLVISAHSDEATMQFARTLGADACLTKPFELSVLIHTARDLVAGQPTRQRSRR